MLMALVLVALSVAVVLVGLKLVWKDEADEPIEPPTPAGHLDERWPTPLAQDVHIVRV